MAENQIICVDNKVDYIQISKAMCQNARTKEELKIVTGVCLACKGCMENLDRVLTSVWGGLNSSLDSVVKAVESGVKVTGVGTRRVTIISAGNEYTALENWNHGFDTKTSASGWFKSAEDVADELVPFSLADDFQIVVEGQLWSDGPYYYFYKLIDGKWIKVLAVYVRDSSEQIFLTHGYAWERDKWEEVYAESFLDLLAPGEYILDVGAWWGNSQAADSYQNFFRLLWRND